MNASVGCAAFALLATIVLGHTMPACAASAAERHAALDTGRGLDAVMTGQGVTVFQKSAYTTIDLAHCTRTRTADGESFLCNGLPGYPIYVAEGDLRAFVAASTAPRSSRAAEQTLGAFNTPFKANSKRAPVEWRIVIRGGKPVPYATIVKYYTRNDTTDGQVFVVMKVAGAESCHVAYVDATGSEDAIVLARQIADERARAFDCRSEPSVVGARGRSPM